MIRIAVCDDVKEEREEVLRCAESFFGDLSRECEITEFSSGKELLDFNEAFDLYLLDVLMPKLDGMSAARELRKRFPDAIIVFITSSLDSAVASYEVEASGFLLKPLSQDSFSDTMDRLLRRGLIGPEAVLSVVSNHLPMEIPLSRIVLLESDLHRVHVRMDRHMISVNQRLSDLEAQLSSHPEFLRCHQSFLVNLRFVEDLRDGRFLLLPEVEAGFRDIPISRTNLKRCKMEYYQFRLNRFSAS